MIKTLGSLLLLATTFGASAQLRETAVATPQLGPAEKTRSSAHVASDGTDFLAAWGDNRGAAIYAARITRDGTVLDPMGIPFPPTIATIGLRVVDVFWCGGAYVVVLQGQDVDTLRSFAAVARIDVNGRVVDPPRIVFREYPYAAASNGSRIVITGGTNIAVLDDRANFIEQSPTGLTGTYSWTAASNGSSFLAVASVYDRENSVMALTLDPNGRPRHSTQVFSAVNQTLVVPASSGYDVFYNDLAKGVVVRFSVTDGNAGPTSPFLGGVNALAVTPTGTEYLMATQAFTGKELQIVHADGLTVLDQHPFVTASGGGNASEPAIASNGREALFVWTQAVGVISDLRAVILDANGNAISAPFSVTRSASEQISPAIAIGGVNDLAAWQESSGIYAARITPAGQPLDGRGIQISPSGIAPQVVSDGPAYVVLWREFDRSARLRWVDAATGTLLGSTIPIGGCVDGIVIARDELGVVAFISDCTGRLTAQRIGLAGPIGAAVPVSPPGVGAYVMSAACNGKEWLVVWEDPTIIRWVGPIPTYSAKTFAQRLLLSLSTVDPEPILVASSDSEEVGGLVATDGHDFMVFWSNRFYPPLGIHARTVSALGALGDPMLLVDGTDNMLLSAAWDGHHYAVAYAARREGYFASYDLMLTHIGLGDHIVVSSSSPDQREMALAAAAGRPLRTAYSRMAMEPQYGGVSRIFVRDLIETRRRLTAH